MKYLAIAALFLVSACGNEATFAGVCPQDGGKFYYPVGSDVASTRCANPVHIKWDHTPITLTVDADFGSDYHKSLVAAVKLWNNKVPGLFSVVPVNGDVNIGIGPVDGTYNGKAWHTMVEGKLTGTVHLLGALDMNTAMWVLAHELGHIVGLAHDGRLESSLMYPELDFKGGLMGQDNDRLPMFVITGSDRDALKAVYR